MTDETTTAGERETDRPPASEEQVAPLERMQLKLYTERLGRLQAEARAAEFERVAYLEMLRSRYALQPGDAIAIDSGAIVRANGGMVS